MHPSIAAYPAPELHHVIESLSILNAIHYRDITLLFSDGLNIVIGARGAGKSGILHLIRFALGAPIPQAYAKEFNRYIEGTLGTGTATVRVRTQHGARYTSSRTVGKAPVVLDEQGNVANVNLYGELFRLEAYFQNEIEGIATDEAAQLALMDKFAAPEIRAIDESVTQIERLLLNVIGRRRRLEAQITEDAAREQELPAVSLALKEIDLGGASASSPAARMERQAAHDAKVLRGRERAAMTALASELASVRSTLDTFTRDGLQKLSRAVEGDLERASHGEVFRRTHAAMQRVAGAIEGSAGRLRTELAGAERAAEGEARELPASHAKEEAAYQLLVVRDEADRTRSRESERLHKRFEELSAVAKRLGDSRREEGAARDEEAALFAERARLLSEKSALRARVCQEWSTALDGEIRASLAPESDLRPWTAVLTDVLRGSGMRADFVETVATRIRPRDLVSMVENNEIGPLVALDTVSKAHNERATRVLAFIRESGRLHEIALARCEDTPLIELKVGKHWRASNRLSTGQRCSCILPILLLQSTAPLLTDQAEDSLDGVFVFHVLVGCLDQTKARRQLIIVTLDPNPPALADADCIHCLDVDEEGRGIVPCAGKFTEPDVKNYVEKLEGGRAAFRKRAERYGLVLPGARASGADVEE